MKLTELALALLPSGLRERISRLRADVEHGNDEEAVDASCDELATSLEEALALTEERHGDLRTMPFEHPSAPALDDLWGPVGTENAAEPLLAQLTETARRLDPNTSADRTGPRLTARFIHDNTPMLWSVHLGLPIAGRDAVVFSFASGSHWLATCVPPDFPNISIRPEGITDSIGKALRLKQEVELGHPAFDDAFFVEGQEHFTDALLTRPVRDALLDRLRLGELTFRVGATTASVAWKTGLIGGVIGSALRPSADILVALRAAFENLPLLRGG
jgi:hypothetical protein